MTPRIDYTLDVCQSNGSALVAREIANYLRRISKLPRPPVPTGIEVELVCEFEGHIERIASAEHAPKGARICWSVYIRTVDKGAVWTADVPSRGAAIFLGEALGELWGLPVTESTLGGSL